MTDLTRPVTRRTRAESTYRNKRRRIVVTLRPGDDGQGLVVLRLGGCRFNVSIAVRDVFLEAVRLDGTKVPRVLKGKKTAKREKPYKKTQAAYSKQYGVKKSLVRGWWKERAPLDNPDAMGERLHSALGR